MTKTTTKKVVKRAPRAKKAPVGPYSASIKILGKVYTASGATAKDALEGLKVGKVAKGMSVITISRQQPGSAIVLSHTKILPHAQTYRLFSPSPLMREIALKNVSLLFSGI